MSPYDAWLFRKEEEQRLKRRRADEKEQLEIWRRYKRHIKSVQMYLAKMKEEEESHEAKMKEEEESRKAKMEAEEEGEDYPEKEEEEEKEHMCSICFSDSGKSIRGRINSCDHYFCFVCKRHFESICRPPVKGLFSVKRVVDVPLRRQGYHGRVPDPYEYIPCSFCSDYDQRRRLVVCGSCDVVIHRSCIGFGNQEDKWYCPDCTICKDWHSRSQLEDASRPQNADQIPRP